MSRADVTRWLREIAIGDEWTGNYLTRGNVIATIAGLVLVVLLVLGQLPGA
jgi:hypothetical protein